MSGLGLRQRSRQQQEGPRQDGSPSKTGNQSVLNDHAVQPHAYREAAAETAGHRRDGAPDCSSSFPGSGCLHPVHEAALCVDALRKRFVHWRRVTNESHYLNFTANHPNKSSICILAAR